MGGKTIIFLIAVMVLISACTDKTIPVVTDISGGAVVVDSQVIVGDEVENETVPVETEGLINESEWQEEEIEESQQQEVILPLGVHVVIIKDLKLDPQELTINQGDTVVWKHEDTYEKEEETRHYIAAHSNEFRSPIFYYGQTFNHTFNKIGTFTYIDIIYKERNNLRGTIIVE